MPHSAFMEWDAEDRAKTLAYMFEEAERCSMCGTAAWEWDEAQGGTKRAYQPVMKTCLGCYYKEIAREGQDIGPGVTVELERPGTMDAAKRAMLANRLARRDRQNAKEAAGK
jgi:hypothetical protein